MGFLERRGPRAVLRLSVAVSLVAAGYLDYQLGFYSSFSLGMAKLGSAALACTVLFASGRLGARGLAFAVAVTGLASLSVTGALFSRHPDIRLDAMGFTEPLALLGLLNVIVRRGRPMQAAMGALFVIATIVLRPAASSYFWSLLFTLVAMPVLWVGLTARLATDDRRRREAMVRLEQRAEFARDLHDFVAHHVTGIVVQAQGARIIAGRRPDLILPALERIEESGAEAMRSMRRMVGMLRNADGGNDAELSPLAGITEVRSLVEGFSPVGAARARLRLDGVLDDLPVEVTTTVHRVVMEALTNVRKHAQEWTEVDVSVVRAGEVVTVKICNDGRTRHTLGVGGFGLRGLAERVGMIGGTIEAGPEATGGWKVDAALPVGGTAGSGKASE
ncbi:sensor histidine kinase [Streptomyces sp. NPDC002403]